MDGPLSDDEPLDAAEGEYLIEPTRIIAVEDPEEDGFYNLVNEILGD